MKNDMPINDHQILVDDQIDGGGDQVVDINSE